LDFGFWILEYGSPLWCFERTEIMGSGIVAEATAVVDDVEKVVNRITGSLIPVAELEQIAIDAVPRKVEGAVYTAGVHLLAMLEVVAKGASLIMPAGSPLLGLLTSVETELSGVLVPPAGSAILRLIPEIVNQVQSYLTASGFVPATPAGKAVVAHIAAQAAQMGSGE
jgi:hypothetical protein